jgi:hypothetical protein
MTRHLLRGLLPGIALLGCLAAAPAGANPPCPLHTYACKHMYETPAPSRTPNRSSQPPAYQPPQPDNYMAHKNAAAAAAAAADRDAILNGRPQVEVCGDLGKEFRDAMTRGDPRTAEAARSAYLVAQCPDELPTNFPHGTIGVRG